MEESESKEPQPKPEDAKRDQLSAIEKDAANLKAAGKTRAALDKLEQAIQFEKKWYHYRCKAQWKFESRDPDGAEQAINEGLEYCDPNQFWLLYWKAEFLFRIRLNVQEAASELLRVEGILYDESSNLEVDFLNVPSCLRWPALVELQGTERTNLKMVLVSLRSDMESMRKSLILFNKITEMEKSIGSERVRTIELLGIFAAILAFIFSGVHIITKLPLFEALLLQAGMAVLLTIFFLGVHLVIYPEARKKVLVIIFFILTIIFFFLPIYARILEAMSDPVQSTTESEIEPAQE